MPHKESDVGNINMITRMIGAAGRTIAGRDPEDLARLAELRDAIDLAVVVAVKGQREAGVFWSSIADALGVTKEAVVQRYGPKVKALTEAEGRRWEDSEALAAGQSVPGGPGACRSCGHAKVWHTPKTRDRPCERCDCPTFLA